MLFPFRRLKQSDLWQVPSPPKELWVQGSDLALQLLERLPEQGLAIVGTRNPLPRSAVFLKNKISQLKNSPLVILSGFARGIDTIAHEAALEARLPTVALLAAGLDFDYPRENAALRSQILQAGGLMVSEFPPGMAAQKHHFLLRNRLIAGWSKATWVVEAGERSGALNTAKWAREQDRTCFAVPSYPGDPQMAGNQTLLDRDHALAFWGIHSLGAVWLDLASQNPLLPGLFKSSDPDETLLIQQITRLTYDQGSARIPELFEWAAARNWDPRRFYLTLERAIQKQLIIEQKGIFLANPGINL